MGPSPSWLFCLLVAALMIDDTCLLIWSKSHDDFPGRRATTISTSGAVLSLFGQGLEHFTRSHHGWLDDIAWFFWFSGLVVVLVGVFGVLRIAWRDRGQRRRYITDPDEYVEAQRQKIAFMAPPLSIAFARVTLESRYGLALGILLIASCVLVPCAFVTATNTGNNRP